MTQQQGSTHDWQAATDRDHLEQVRGRAAELTDESGLHMVLEVLAYADEEAEGLGRVGTARVTCRPDGSLTISDDGRGTAVRREDSGATVRKPVMSTPDLRFFDADPPAVLLPDGRPRRGISTVAALSTWLVHTTRRQEGSWTQRYEHGVPVTGLDPVADDGGTGTTVSFLLDPELAPLDPHDLHHQLAAVEFPWLRIGEDISVFRR